MSEPMAAIEMNKYDVSATETRDILTNMMMNGWARLDGEQVVLMSQDCKK